MITRRSLILTLLLALTALPASAQVALRGVTVAGATIGAPFDPLNVSGQAPEWLYRTDELVAVPDGEFDPWSAAIGPNLQAVSAFTKPSIGTGFDGLRSVNFDGTNDMMYTGAITSESEYRFVYDGSTWEMAWVMAVETEPSGALRSRWGTGGFTGTDPGVAFYLYGSAGGANRGKVMMDIANGTSVSKLLDFNVVYPFAHVLQYRFDPAGSPKGRFYIDGVELANFSGSFTPADVAGDNKGFVVAASPQNLNLLGDGFQRLHVAYSPMLSDLDSARLAEWALRYLETGP